MTNHMSIHTPDQMNDRFPDGMGPNDFGQALLPTADHW